jgi:glucan phosphoethanolaminetransferase (alkaline phosphatase superfamily)
MLGAAGMSKETDGTRPSHPSALRNYPFLAALGFSLFLLISEEYQFYFPQAAFLGALPHMELSFRIMGITAVVGSFLLMFAFFWISFTSRPAYKAVYFVAFTVAVLTQYNYQAVAGRFMTRTDFLAGVTSPLNYWVDAAVLFFEWVGLIPIALYLLLLLVLRQSELRGGKAMAIFTAVALIANSLIHFTGFAQSPALSAPAFWRTITVAALDRSTVIAYERETVAYQAAGRPSNNIVLIIDESVRGDHLSVNGYHRDTTPYLRQIAEAGLITNWGLAAAAATCSIPSNKAIIMGLSALPDRENRVHLNPTIFQYAQAAGYETHYLDAQVNYLWNGMTASDLNAVDHWLRRRDLGDEADFAAADYIASTVSQSTGHFIVLNKYGVHFHYDAIYPPEETVWRPVPDGRQYNNPAEIINTYDNAIRYNLENFFRRLLPDVDDLQNTTYLYTSDHGQTLLQDGETWLHCGNTRNEAIVPLLMISAADYDLNTAYRASHFNIFATLLDLMAVPEQARRHDYPLSLFQATAAESTDRYFLGGVVNVRGEGLNPILVLSDEVLINFDAEK